MTDAFTLTLKEEDGKLVHILHAENTTSYTFDTFSVDVTLTDEDGNVIDSGSSDTLNSFAPGSSEDVIVYLDGDPDPAQYTVKLVPQYTTDDIETGEEDQEQ